MTPRWTKPAAAIGAFLWIALAATAEDTPGKAKDANPRPADSAPRRAWAADAEKVHDPSGIVESHGVRRLFCTGPGISLMQENAAGQWQWQARVFAEGQLPRWHDELVPGNRGYLWAPDVIRRDDKFFLYYSVSTFGKNTSAIGLAIGGAVDPADAQWQWEDRGPVLASRAGDSFNAIDPTVFKDQTSGALWLAFGSFWKGIFLVELDPATGLQKDESTRPIHLAWAPEIEAPFLYQRNGFYYLFLNWGKCCRGVNSTYEIRVGRSRAVTGPYVDRSGVPLADRGGTMVLSSDDRWIGPGHASIFNREEREWLVHHYYDRELGGRARLRMLPLTWDADDWPVVNSPKDGAAQLRRGGE